MKQTLTLLAALLLASFAAAPTVRAQAPETGAESTKPKSKPGTVPVEFGYRPDGGTRGLSRTRGRCICSICSGAPLARRGPPPRPITSATLLRET